MALIKILAGSTRPGRFNIQPARWIYELAQKEERLTAELLDLQDIGLPFLDEPTPPSVHKYTKDHTLAWAAAIEEADGFVFVTPEYNHSYSPVLKNAIDYLYQEWNYKPVSFVSYGSLAGGSRAVEHLRGIAGEVKMYDLREQILLPNYWEHLNEAGEYQFNERHVEAARKILRDLNFWAEKMKLARTELKDSQG